MDWRKRRNLEESYWWSAWNRQEWILCSYPFTIKRKALKGLGKISTSLPSSNKIKTHWCLQSHRKGKCLPLETLPLPRHSTKAKQVLPLLEKAKEYERAWFLLESRGSLRSLGLMLCDTEATWTTQVMKKEAAHCDTTSLVFFVVLFGWMLVYYQDGFFFFLADQGSMTIYRMINSSISIYWKSTKCPETSTNR